MNLTTDFITFTNIIKKEIFISNFSLRCEKNVANCSEILKSITECEKNIEKINKISNQTSLFNDSHLKLNNLVENIKERLNHLQEDIEAIEKSKLNNTITNTPNKQALKNIIETIKSRLFKASEKFKKSLQSQTSKIKQVEERRMNLTANHKTNKNAKKNPFVYSNLPNNEPEHDEEAVITLNQNQKTSNNNIYYQERTSAVQKIERTMHELSGMFSKMAHYVNEAQYMIEKIEQSTNDSLSYVEKGEKEVNTYHEGIKSNKALFLKVFFILIFSSVMYIVFLA